jgi:hypothetical protein
LALCAAAALAQTTDNKKPGRMPSFFFPVMFAGAD